MKRISKRNQSFLGIFIYLLQRSERRGRPRRLDESKKVHILKSFERKRKEEEAAAAAAASAAAAAAPPAYEGRMILNI